MQAGSDETGSLKSRLQTLRRPRALLLQLPAVLPVPPTEPKAQSDTRTLKV